MIINRVNFMHKALKIITFTLFLTSCSGYGGVWPKLNDPLPNASDRSRVSEAPHIEITQPGEIESESVSLSLHKSRSDVIFTDIEKEWEDFDSKLNAIKNETERDDKLIAWSGSQFTLSRISDEINKLRIWIEMPIAEPSSDVENYVKSIEARLAKHNQRLATAKETITALKPK